MHISGLNSAALYILKQAGSANPPDASALIKAANGVAAQTAPARVDTTDYGKLQQEAQAYEQVGKALGVDRAKFASDAAFGKAMQVALNSLKVSAGTHWSQVKKAIEHETGLDKLGVSVETLVNAAAGDGGALKTLLDSLAKHPHWKAGSSASGDGTGTYTPSSATPQT